MLVDIANEQSVIHDVTVIIINDMIDSELLSSFRNKVGIKCLKRTTGSKNPLPFFKLNLLIFQLKPDVIHCHNESLVNLLPFKKCLIVRTVHTTGNTTKVSLKYDKLFSISDAVKKDIFDTTGIHSEVVINGIPCDIIKKKESFDRNLPIRIVQIGRLLIEAKGQDLTLRMLKNLVDDGIKATVDFIGDGEDKEQLVNLSKQLNIETNVNFKGLMSRENIYNCLCKYDLFVLPSRREGFGLSVAEAMVAKVPVIISNIPGPMQVINNGMYGSSFTAGDLNDYTNKVETFIREGIVLRQVQDASKYAMNAYDVSNTARQYNEWYERLS